MTIGSLGLGTLTVKSTAAGLSPTDTRADARAAAG
jgi:hypothetical protein